MCYALPGPRCSSHARDALISAKARGNEQEIITAQDDYDETDEGQKMLQSSIDNNSKNLELSSRLKSAKLRREDKMNRYKTLESEMQELTAQSKDKKTKKSSKVVRDTDPALAIPAPEPIGRLYRMPGSEALPVSHRGNPIMPDDATMVENILSGTYVPSVTNVLGVRSSPHIVPWATRKAAWGVVDELRENPDLLTEGTSAMVTRAAAASDRVRDEAAEQGTTIHLACEMYARGEELPAMTPKELAHFNNFKKFVAEFRPKFLHNEATVFGHTPTGEGYAGTADAIVEIDGVVYAIDYKNNRSGLHTDVSRQLSAVANGETLLLDNGSTIKMPHIQGGFAVHLSEERYRVVPVELDGEPWKNFCALRQTWTSHVFDGMMSNGKNMLGRAVTSPSQLKATR